MLADQRFPHLCRLPRLRIALSGRLAHQACRLRGPHLPLLGWIEARIKVIQLVQDPVWICICVLPSGCAALLQHPGSNWSNRVGAPGACRPAGAVRALPPATPAALCPVAGPAACLRGSSVSGGSWPRAVAPRCPLSSRRPHRAEVFSSTNKNQTVFPCHIFCTVCTTPNTANFPEEGRGRNWRRQPGTRCRTLRCGVALRSWSVTSRRRGARCA